MSRIFQLKEWLTPEDAARHLTGALKEDVSVADILQLALDGRLCISVNLVNHAKAKRRLIISAAEAGTWKMPLPITKREDLTSPDARGRQRRRQDAPDRGYEEYELPAGTPLDDGRVLTYGDDTVHTIDGVWDLAMFGGERIAVENLFQRYIKGPRADLVNIDGSFLVHPYLPDEVWSIQALGTTQKLNPEWKRLKDSGESTDGVKPYLEETEDFYYPESGLPEGSMLVVRVLHLQRFISDLNDPAEEIMNPRAENSYEAVIGALLTLMLEADPNGGTRSGFVDQAAIIEGILVRFPDVPGLKKRSLEDKFAKGKRRVQR